jgi:hypothetical protein
VGSFLPLFGVTVEHQFFGLKACVPFDFVPTSATTVSLAQCGLLVRSSPNGITVFCEDEAQADLRRATNVDDKSLMLEFKVFPRDRDFAKYTDPVTAAPSAVLYFDSWRAVKDPDGRQRLHPDECASEKFFEDWNSPLIRTAVATRDAIFKPSFLVNISVNDPLDETGLQPAIFTPASYYIRFAARKTFWKYYFFGDLGNKNLYIADLNGNVEFKCLGTTEVANSKVALTFVSGTTIPMQDTPEQRFQLRENGAMGEKVVIKRLPNASVGQINKEIIEENAVLVSEMYIN